LAYCKLDVYRERIKERKKVKYIKSQRTKGGRMKKGINGGEGVGHSCYVI
jgi:hypothetical protein